MEHQRAVTLLFAVAGLGAAIFVRSAFAAIGAFAGFEDPSLGGIASLSTGLAALAGVGTTWYLLRRADATEFVASVVDELTKIHWPSRDETVNNTTIVVATTIFFATLLSVYDFAWARLTGLFLFSGS